MKRVRGFTLIEVIISLALFSAATLAIMKVLAVGFQSYKDGRVLISMQQNVRKVADIISSEVREVEMPSATATTVLQVGGCNAWTYNGALPQTSVCAPCSSASSITFRKIDPFTHGVAGSIVTGGGEEQVVYTFANNQVSRQAAGSPVQTLNTSDINIMTASSSFSSVCTNSAPVINLTLLGQKQTSETKTFSLQTQIGVRPVYASGDLTVCPTCFQLFP